MEGEEKYISVCGRYHCGLCSYHKGSIVEAAKQLLPFLENVGSLRIMAKEYGTCDYDELLKGVRWLGSQSDPCMGCRLGGGWSWWPDCPVRDCCMGKGLDFCYQCDEFPCNRLKEEPLLEHKKAIIEANMRIHGKPTAEVVKLVKEKYKVRPDKSV